MNTNNTEDTAEIFNSHRGLLFGIAYRMLSSASEAEDIVQDAFVRWLQADKTGIESPRAYLSTVVVRLCIDQERSARAKREVYVGSWLPEPIPSGQVAAPDDTAIMTESLGFAFLIMLQSLGPLERAVFLLREVFDYGYGEIATIVGKSEANCRQVLHRAHARLEERRPRFNVSREQQQQITSQFVQATVNGDIQGLLSLLTDNVVFIGDGGGKVNAGLKPVHGPDKVVRGMLGGLSRWAAGITGAIEEINGQPAIVGYLNGATYGVVLFSFDGDKVSEVYTVLNPDKLGWIVQPQA